MRYGKKICDSNHASLCQKLSVLNDFALCKYLTQPSNFPTSYLIYFHTLSRILSSNHILELMFFNNVVLSDGGYKYHNHEHHSTKIPPLWPVKFNTT
jgi:hypothetical protein